MRSELAPQARSSASRSASRCGARPRRLAARERELARRRHRGGALRRDRRRGAPESRSDVRIARSASRNARLTRARLARAAQLSARTRGFAAHGVPSAMAGMTLEAAGCEAPVGSRCLVVDHDGARPRPRSSASPAASLLLVATDEIGDVTPGARVIPSGKVFEARAGRGCSAASSTAPASRSTAWAAALRRSHPPDAAAAESARCAGRFASRSTSACARSTHC